MFCMCKKIFFFSFLFCSCYSSDVKFVRKAIEDKGVKIQWYFYSYITSNSPDIISIVQSGETKEVYKATWHIADVNLKNDSIIIRTVKPVSGVIYTKHFDPVISGYKIVIDSSAKHEELLLIPDGIKERY